MKDRTISPQEVYKRAENELLLHVNKRLYTQGAISEIMYNEANQKIIEGLTNPQETCIINVC